MQKETFNRLLGEILNAKYANKQKAKLIRLEISKIRSKKDKK